MYYGYYGYGLSGYNLIGIGLVLLGSMLMLWAQMKVNRNYSKYSKIRNSRGMTGHEVARAILDSNGLYDVEVREVRGNLSDHYDPRHRTLNLSNSIYNGATIAALAVAAHECGHAIQHKENYKPMTIRSAIVPICNIGQSLGWVAVFLGLLLGNTNIAWIGVILMSSILAFQLITLPVEFDASARALSILNDRYLNGEEYTGAKNMLSAAALTYVAAMLSTLLQLLRIVLMVISRDHD